MNITVLIELEEWDDTTDAIIWLLEQEYPKLEHVKLYLGENPEGWQSLEYQRADLEAWLEHEKVSWMITAEYIEIPEKDEEGETVYVDGYKITVDKRIWDKKKSRFRHKRDFYTVKGADRKEFKIIKKETT